MAAAWGQLFGLMLVLLFTRPLSGDFATIFKTVLVMGAVSNVLKIVTITALNNWATNINQAWGATAITGTLVFIGINFAIQQTDIPLISDNVEKIIRYVFYFLGGGLMAGASQWNDLFSDVTKIPGVIFEVVKDIINIVGLGLATV